MDIFGSCWRFKSTFTLRVQYKYSKKLSWGPELLCRNSFQLRLDPNEVLAS